MRRSESAIAFGRLSRPIWSTSWRYSPIAWSIGSESRWRQMCSAMTEPGWKHWLAGMQPIADAGLLSETTHPASQP